MTNTASQSGTGNSGMTIFGVVAIILGFLCMLTPFVTGIAVAIMVGALILIGGIVRIIWAFKAETLGRRLVRGVIGVLTLVCGLFLVSDPLLATGFLTILLSAYLIADGICEIAAGTQLKPTSGWGWMVFGGILSILLGLMIWGQFPLSGAWAIGILLGIKLFFIGLIMVNASSAIPAETSRETP
jgi:uncharacterized membrane protein HdeD (DUF308 family)